MPSKNLNRKQRIKKKKEAKQETTGEGGSKDKGKANDGDTTAIAEREAPLPLWSAPLLRRPRILPHYLYTVVSHNSKGEVTETQASSKGLLSDPKSFWRLESEQASAELKEHITQWPHIRDDFVQWTSSFLCALESARTAAQKDAGVGGRQPVRIYILNTRVVDKEIIFPASYLYDLLGIKPTAWDPRSRTFDEYYGSQCIIPEYLSHGSIDIHGCCGFAPYDLLVSKGLYDVIPELQGPETESEEDLKPSARVADLRDAFWNHDEPDLWLPQSFPRAIFCASSFGSEWAFVIAIALTSLRKRRSNEGVAIGLASFYSHERFNPCHELEKLHSVYEVDEFHRLYNLACAEMNHLMAAHPAPTQSDGNLGAQLKGLGAKFKASSAELKKTPRPQRRNMEAHVPRLRPLLRATEAQVKDLKPRRRDWEAQVKDLKLQLRDLEAQVKISAPQQRDSKAPVEEDLKPQRRDMETEMEDLGAQFKNTGAQLKDLRPQLTDLEARLSNLGSQRKDLEAQLTRGG